MQSKSLASRGNTWRQSAGQCVVCNDDENICSICFQKYLPTDCENNPWILCDGCELWIFLSCVVIDTHNQNNKDLDEQFTILKKFRGKLECLVYEMLFIQEMKPKLNTQSDSIKAKLFNT